MTPPVITPFDLAGPLPTGVAVLEASAGTGKTYALAALATRFVAEGVPLQDLLLVTFTRMATGELRERVRERLVAAHDWLGVVADRGQVEAADPVLALLANGSPDEIGRRRRRLGVALADFDAATIATTHEFCHHVLRGLGVVGDAEADVVFAEDIGDLLHEVVDDLYLQRFAAGPPPPFRRGEAREIGDTAVRHPSSPVEPVDAGGESVPGMRRSFALAVRRELDRRKRMAPLLTFDDLLTRLSETLAHPGRGEEARRRLRERYRVVLVDEFQDTDPVQWDIMSRAFGGGDATLVLIGDPKQAIYSFRGADVYSYLKAARAARTRHTLATNWRSDAGLLAAYDALFRGATLGHEAIAYRRVEAAPANAAPRLVGAPVPVPLRFRVVHREDGLVRLSDKIHCVLAESGQNHVAADLAGDVVRLLSSGAQVLARGSDGSETGQAIRPGDVAVLVRRNVEASLVQEALKRVGVPAVISALGSVFGTDAADQWVRLLEALLRPSSGSLAARAALTSFLGRTPDDLAAADEAAQEELHARLFAWSSILRRRGVAALLDTITAVEGLPARVLSRDSGEREITDLRHIGQLLHDAATSEQLGPTALLAWLSRRVAEAAQDAEDEDRARRLETDDEAVQILTFHRCKGLEFPVVYCPFLWREGYFPEKAPAIYHDAANDDRWTLDVGLEGNAYYRHRQKNHVEQQGEDLRLSYVALTRAEHQAVVWWAAGSGSENSPLARLLLRDGGGKVEDFGAGLPEDAGVVARLEELAAEAPGCVSVERSVVPSTTSWAGDGRGAAPALSAGSFDRVLDTRWRRTSYSGITATAHESRAWSEPEEAGIADEPEGEVAPVAPAAPGGDEAALRSSPSLWAALPGGLEVGTFVHAVLEDVDFTAADLPAAVGRAARSQAALWGLAGGNPDAFTPAIAGAIGTPLGPAMDGLRLRDVGPGDRLNELGFELPLVGGDVPTAALAVRRIGSLLRAHLPPGDVMAAYAERLDDPRLARDLHGYLAGSIDLVLRLRGHGGFQRFAVVDYKTNWLGPPGEPLAAWHYRPSAMAAEMIQAHYPLQALLYSVALHRYLRWRLPAYSAGRNLAGVAYLFLRGMAGTGTPLVAGQPCGVFAWQPPATLVEALSDLLEHGR